MSIQLEIPDSVAQAMRLPGGECKHRLMVELALSLYDQGILSFGKARQLPGLSKFEFGLLLGKRGIPRHYDDEDLRDDLSYVNRQ